MSNRYLPISFRLTPEDMAALDAEAERRGISRSACLVAIIRRAVGTGNGSLEERVDALEARVTKLEE
jgi:Ribbon-helix-helix protein, copG family